MELILLGLCLLLIGGAAAASFSRWPRLASGCGVLGVALGCATMGGPTADTLMTGQSTAWTESWDSAHGAFHVGIDALSAFFMAPAIILSVAAGIYGASYMAGHVRQKRLGGHWFFFNVFVAGMAATLIARTVVLYLVAWEAMSLAAYALVTFEHEKDEVRRAGWVYLIAAHVGVACILAAFLLLGARAGTLDFDVLREQAPLSAELSGIVFLLALVGFGAKAGLVPVHVWLPEAHPAAPSHVSALMSGAMVNMGIYGLLRTVTLLGTPQAWWGVCLVIVGLSTAVFGIALALGQRDVKRVLAYSTIENMGLVVASLGVGLWGLAVDQTAISVLGFASALLHVWNHAAAKGLMFLAAGSVLHATGTKDAEQLGGLMKRMPWTGCVMMLGAVAIAALPPLNGFLGKWLLYLGLVSVGLDNSDVLGVGALLATGAIAAVGCLAAMTFVRLVGITLLGEARSDAARHAHECSWGMRGPMLLLGALCVSAGLVPQQLVPCLRVTSRELSDGNADVPSDWMSVTERLKNLGVMNAAAWTGVLIAGGLLGRRLRLGGIERARTWGCGYRVPTPRMQYTASSFSELMAARLLPRRLRPRIASQQSSELFAAEGSFSSSCPDPVTRDVYEPFFVRWSARFAALRVVQQGKMHVYLVYIMVVVLIGLSWVAIRNWLNMS